MAGVNGALVRILREKDGCSRKAFAEKIGISLQYLCDIEDGRRSLKRNPGLIKTMAEALNVPTSMLEYRSSVA
jgi:transcriptional regulator with XRE-family HTH domain